MKVYKVVRRSPNGKLGSAFAYGRAHVTYEPGQWAEAPKWLFRKGYGLFAFDTENQAIEWIHNVPVPGLEVWEAEAREILPVPPILDLNLLAQGVMAQPEDHEGYPPGTIVCRAIRLTRPVFQFK